MPENVDAWIKTAHSRAIMNTVSNLRELKAVQEERCLEHALTTLYSQSSNPVPEVSDLLELPAVEQLSEEEKKKLQRLYPLAFLSEEAQSLPMDLEAVWRRCLVQLLEKDRAAYFKVNIVTPVLVKLFSPRQMNHRVAEGAVSTSSSCLVKAEPSLDNTPQQCPNPHQETKDMSTSRSSSDAHFFYQREDAAGASPDATRGRKRARTEGRSTSAGVLADGYWLTQLPNMACVEFAKRCIAQSLERCKSHGDHINHSLTLLSECVAKSEHRIANGVARVPSSHPQQSSPSKIEVVRIANEGPLTETSFSLQDFQWQSVPLSDATNDTSQLEHETDQYILDGEPMRNLQLSAVLCGQVDSSEHMRMKVIEGNVRIPIAATGALLTLKDRGVVAASKLTFK